MTTNATSASPSPQAQTRPFWHVQPGQTGLPAGFHFFERGWLSSNNLLLVSPESTVLIDSSYVSHAAQTLTLLQAVLQERPLDQLLNTHLHSDHCGGNASLQTHFGQLQTWIPPGLSHAVADWDVNALSYAATGQDCPTFAWTHALRPGQLFDAGATRWEVHAAPGHDPHAVLLFEPVARILVSADALWKQGFGVVFPELDGSSGFDEVAQTLDLIESLAPACVIPGHGPLFTDTAAALQAARGRLAAFARAPHKHRRHALKVLIKFRLLDWGSVSESALLAWALRTPYVQSILAQCVQPSDQRACLEEVLSELAQAGALRREQGQVHNL